MGRKTIEIVLSRKDRAELEAIVADGNTHQKIAKRARIVLLTAEGTGVMAIMRQVEVSKTSVWRWQERFAEAGVAGLLKDKSKKPGKAPIADDIKRKVIETAVKERPANATHWSLRMLGAEIGISHTSVQRILGEHGLKPRSDAHVQGLQRPRLLGQSERYRRALHEPARQGDRALGR